MSDPGHFVGKCIMCFQDTWYRQIKPEPGVVFHEQCTNTDCGHWQRMTEQDGWINLPEPTPLPDPSHARAPEVWDLQRMGDRRQAILKRIMARTEKHGCCLLWTGPTSGDGRGGGYPRMSLGGQTVAVHKVVFTHFHGFIPGKKQVDHTCRNRLCLNPGHLELVSHLENQRRRARANRGESS